MEHPKWITVYFAHFLKTARLQSENSLFVCQDPVSPQHFRRFLFSINFIWLKSSENIQQVITKYTEIVDFYQRKNNLKSNLTKNLLYIPFFQVSAIIFSAWNFCKRKSFSSIFLPNEYSGLINLLIWNS